MADVTVSDNAVKGQIVVADGGGGGISGGGVRPALMVWAMPRGAPPGAQLVLDLSRGFSVADIERSQRWGQSGIETGWSVQVDGAMPPGKLRYSIRLLAPDGGVLATAGREVTVIRRGETGFVPSVHGFAFTNNPHMFGVPRPPWPVFQQTFSSRFAPGRRRIFDGVYRSIFDTGLCTGIARAAASLHADGRGDPAAKRSVLDPGTRELIQILHGKQLTDRALLSAARWLLRSSPRQAFVRFRRAVLNPNTSPVVIDVGVPVPYRRDFLRAVVSQGHTVLPYAYRLLPGARAEMEVYDPQFPGSEQASGEYRIEIDLAADRYRYRHWSSEDPGNRTTLLAVSLDAYTRGRSAFLIGLGSLMRWL